MPTNRSVAVLGDFFLWDANDKPTNIPENIAFLQNLKDSGAYLILVTRRVNNHVVYKSLKSDLDFDYHGIFDQVHEELGFPRADEFAGRLPRAAKKPEVTK